MWFLPFVSSEREVLPERGGHEGLADLVIHEQCLDLGLGEQVHGDVLGLLEMLLRQALHTCSEEAVGEVVRRAWIGADGHPRLPLAPTVTRLLIQFTTRTLYGVFALLAHPGTQFIAGLAQAVAVLALYETK